MVQKLSNAELFKRVNAGESIRSIAQSTGYNYVSLHKRCKRNGIQSYRAQNKPLSAAEVQQIQALYNAGHTMTQIRNKFKVRTQKIVDAISQPRVAGKTVTLDERYFENIDTAEKAYWYGVLMADGSISIRPSGQHIIRFEVASKDRSWVEDFLRAVQSDHKVVVRMNGTCLSASAQLTSKRMVQDLMKNGMPLSSKNKSVNSCVSKNAQFESAFWRGIFDGDGSISIANNVYVNVVTSKSQKLIADAKAWLDSQGFNGKYKVYSTGGVATVRLFGVSAIEYLDILYRGKGSRLDRKYQKYRSACRRVGRSPV